MSANPEFDTLKTEILKPDLKPEFKVAVGLSRQWDARKAGREVAVDVLNRLGTTPDFALVFSTIHYKNKGGFKELLNGIYDILPKNVSLAGGTTAGFIIPQGCFTHGVTVFAVKSEALDFAIAVEKNIKRNPKKAAEKCAAKIKKALVDSKFKNKFLLVLPSGITTLKLPGFPENLRVIRSKWLSKLLLIGTRLSLLLFQKGPGRELTILKELSEKLSDYQMIGGSFVDDNKGYENYQFYYNEVYTNMLITLGISTNYNIKISSTSGLTATDKKFKITKKSTYNMVIEEVNGRKAFNEILSIMKWPTYFLEEDSRALHRTIYTPIGYTINGQTHISVMAFILGDSIMVSPEILSPDAFIMRTSGADLINSVDLNLKNTSGKDIKFGFIASCSVRLETLGYSVYKVHEKLLKHFGDTPFIQIDVVGEDVYTKELGPKRMAETFNSAVFYSD